MDEKATHDCIMCCALGLGTLIDGRFAQFLYGCGCLVSSWIPTSLFPHLTTYNSFLAQRPKCNADGPSRCVRRSWMCIMVEQGTDRLVLRDEFEAGGLTQLVIYN